MSRFIGRKERWVKESQGFGARWERPRLTNACTHDGTNIRPVYWSATMKVEDQVFELVPVSVLTIAGQLEAKVHEGDAIPAGQKTGRRFGREQKNGDDSYAA
ncbi:MAG: hypothetical protein WEB30_07305 [Cyclobacteriaceae bacterium]